MPNRRISVFNPEGESYVTEEERFNEQRRQAAMADWMALQQIQNRKRAQQSTPRQSAPRQSAQPQSEASTYESAIVDTIKSRPQFGGRLNARNNHQAQLDEFARFAGDKNSDHQRTIELDGNFTQKSGHEIAMQNAKDAVDMRKLDNWEMAYKDKRGDESSDRDLHEQVNGIKSENLKYGVDSTRMSPQDLVLWEMAKERGLENQFLNSYKQENPTNNQMIDDMVYGDMKTYQDRQADQRKSEMNKQKLNQAYASSIVGNGDIPVEARAAAGKSLGIDEGMLNTTLPFTQSDKRISDIASNIAEGPEIMRAVSEISKLAQKGGFAAIREKVGDSSAAYSEQDFATIKAHMDRLDGLINSSTLSPQQKAMVKQDVKTKLEESLGYDGLFAPDGRAEAAAMINNG